VTRAASLSLLALGALAAATARAGEVPALSGRVVDRAGVLDGTAQERLTDALADHERRTSEQLVVLTIRTLDGEPIEDFAERTFRAWRLGQAGKDNGVLLVVAIDDRRMRIEVGYGLEGRLTDAAAGRIIRDVMAPAFRAGAYADGIARGVEAILSRLGDEGHDLAARGEGAAKPPEEARGSAGVDRDAPPPGEPNGAAGRRPWGQRTWRDQLSDVASVVGFFLLFGSLFVLSSAWRERWKVLAIGGTWIPLAATLAWANGNLGFLFLAVGILLAIWAFAHSRGLSPGGSGARELHYSSSSFGGGGSSGGGFTGGGGSSGGGGASGSW
jgi:uncharacterized protein